jgi:signal transduction histidine kinase
MNMKSTAAHPDNRPIKDHDYDPLSVLPRKQWDEFRPDETLYRVLQEICENSDWRVGLLYGIDKQSRTLRQIACWCGSSDVWLRFGVISERHTYACGVGFCGEIWRSEKAIWIPNIIEDAGYIRSRPAFDAGLHTVAGFPLWNAGHVVGVMELYSDRILEADEALLETMEVLGRQIGQIIERMKLDMQSREYCDELFESERSPGRKIDGLSRAAETLQAIYRRLGEVQESERHRLASQLHDQVGQSLTALNINLSLMKKQLSSDASINVGPLLDDSISLVEDVFGNIRDVMMELYHAVLKSDGLISALRWSAEQFRKRTDVTTEVVGEEPNPRLPSTVEITLFRVAQECLSNMAKHAHASAVTVMLETGIRLVRLTTTDNGIGFNTCLIPSLGQEHGWGTQIMRERLAAIGGRLFIESAMGRGTRIIAEVPR